MTFNQNDIADVSLLIQRDFGLESSELVDIEGHEALKKQLSQIISYLLDQDFQRLLTAMYRIDIREDRFKAALSMNPPSEVAPTIAQLILDREMQKVITRRKYSK